MNVEKEVIITGRLLYRLSNHLYRTCGSALEETARAAELLECGRIGDNECDEDLYRNIVTPYCYVERRGMTDRIWEIYQDPSNNGKRRTRNQCVLKKIHSAPGG